MRRAFWSPFRVALKRPLIGTVVRVPLSAQSLPRLWQPSFHCIHRSFCSVGTSDKKEDDSENSSETQTAESESEYESEYEEDYEEEYEEDSEEEEEEHSCLCSPGDDDLAPDFDSVADNSLESVAQMEETFEFLPQIRSQMSWIKGYALEVDSDGVLERESQRVDFKPIEFNISPLTLKPLEKLPSEYHNHFARVLLDFAAIEEGINEVPNGNEAELRQIIHLAFSGLSIHTRFVTYHFDLRHSVKHYLLRKIRKKHTAIVHKATKKLLYGKYPFWVSKDNWAAFDTANESWAIDCSKDSEVLNEDTEKQNNSNNPENATGS